MIRYKLDVLAALRAAGYNTLKLRNEKLLSESTIQKLRRGDTSITLVNLDTICRMLNCQPADLIEYCSAEDAAGGEVAASAEETAASAETAASKRKR